MTVLVAAADNPYQRYLEFSGARAEGDEDTLLIVPFRYEQYWIGGQEINLAAVYWFTGEVIQYGVFESNASALSNGFPPESAHAPALKRWLSEQNVCLFELNEPLLLDPVSIPKPWGREIWYTGVEQRGIACFGRDARKVPIPYLLHVMPQILGRTESRSLVLLKILDPFPEEVFGDLYFEFHREKQEVYVVTQVDTRAWPDGVGQMRLGFDPEKVREAGNEKEFRQQFLRHVLEYRTIRFQIDNLLDDKRKQHGYPLDAEVPLVKLKQWLAEIPNSLADKEVELRQAMENYFGTLPLRVGDVVKVPLNVPHSLQHGVRTIEFQTPVYERQILAFAQKVITQKEWDTERGVEEMKVVAPSLTELPKLPSDEGVRIEQVADFSDFEVQRVSLSPSYSYCLQGDVYQLLIVIEGVLIAGKQKVGPEQAILAPPRPGGTMIQPQAEKQLTFVVAKPIT